MTKSKIIRILIVIVGISVILFGRNLYYYSGRYQAPQVEVPSYTQVSEPQIPSADYVDSFTPYTGTILIDVAHENAFNVDEINPLILRLISRGLTVDFLSIEDDFAERLLGEQKESELEPIIDVSQEEESELALQEMPLVEVESEEIQEEESITMPNAFIIICPQEEYLRDEIENVKKFVANGGKLLIINDPTRWGLVNNLAYNFGVVFESDYLYNMQENDVNYRNIFITQFVQTDLTKKLSRIALYTAGSISSNNLGIAYGDENTHSSQIETSKRLSPMALTKKSKVLSIYDLTFLTEPYNGVLDNNQLISNIADWLAIKADHY